MRDQVNSFLRSLAPQVVLYFKVPGNAGDSLIHSGTLDAFARARVRFDYVEMGDDVRGQTVIIGGGGNLVPFYENVRDAIALFVSDARRIIVLPHTIREHASTLTALGSTATIMCRDVPSLEHVQRVNPTVHSIVAHDMAFHLNVARFMKDPALGAIAAPVLRQKLDEVGTSPEEISSLGEVAVMRHDGERHPSAPLAGLDLSELFLLGYAPQEAKIATWCFLKSIALTQHLVTDRLHVAIGAALLGKSCSLYDNSYGKNRAIYEFSLRGFPTVLFREYPVEEST
jgi:exopolysaccharide biosynthesis predicted pyruvyltransferase EpsI